MSEEVEDVGEVVGEATITTDVLQEIPDHPLQAVKVHLRGMSLGLCKGEKSTHIYRMAVEDVDRLRSEDQILSHLDPEPPFDVGIAKTILHHQGSAALP